MNQFRTQVKELLWVGKDQLSRGMDFIRKDSDEIKPILNRAYKNKPNEYYKINNNVFELSYSAKEIEVIVNDEIKIHGDYKINKKQI